jgi:hydrogenase maturation protease
MNILIACIGNIFRGDDAFGCEVAAVLARRPQLREVRLVDFGIRGIDLAYALMDGPDLTIFVDAVSRGGPPGSLYTIEPDSGNPGKASEADIEAGIDAHRMDPLQVLRSVKRMGIGPRRILLVGCEPGDLGGEEGRMGLTPEVAASVSEAAEIVESLIALELEGLTV